MSERGQTARARPKAVHVCDPPTGLHGEYEVRRDARPPAAGIRLRHRPVERGIDLDEPEVAGVGVQPASEIAPSTGPDERFAHGPSIGSGALKTAPGRPAKRATRSDLPRPGEPLCIAVALRRSEWLVS